MKTQNESVLRKVAREIRKEAAHQFRGFPKDELGRQALGGWGKELANQLFGTPRRGRRYSRSR
jgi:hypothetical protein